jgi:DUF1680 family protein
MERVVRVVAEFAEVQNADGYIGALAGGLEAFTALSKGKIRSGGFDLNGLWSPWYVEHKIFAGLRDAHRYAGNDTALQLEIRFAGWVEQTLSNLTDAQNQQMLNTEFGGMGEVLADLYADTGDSRWMILSNKFEHHRVIDPLSNGEDHLGGLHANTQIPKLIGSLKRYTYTGSQSDGKAAEFFWDSVVAHHSFASGGHGKDEYFGPPDELGDRLDGRTDESCNVYNMLKLTRGLFALHPNIKYAEFQERALYNHVLASINPDDGSMCYMVPIGRGVRHEYQDMFHDFTCCVGTGMENHALHGYGVYYESGSRLWVNLYTPSTVNWASRDVRISVDTSLPLGDDAQLTVDTPSPKTFTLTLRRPAWADIGFGISVNGKSFKTIGAPGSYVDITRKWQHGDRIDITIPKALYALPVPDNDRRAALMWGPLMLTGDMGPEDGPSQKGIPVFLGANRPVSDWLMRDTAQAAVFHGTGLGRETATGGDIDIPLRPFYLMHRRTYAGYWDLYTPEEWEAKVAELTAEREKQLKLDAMTVAFVQPGEMQSERDFNEQGINSTPELTLGKHGRRGSDWFSFDIPVEPQGSMTLAVTYCSEEFAKTIFTILADGQIIGTQTISRTAPGSPSPTFYDMNYQIPLSITQNKSKITIKFSASTGSEIAAVYGLRMMRTEAP